MTKARKNLLATLHGGDICGNIVRMTDRKQHSDDSLIGATVERAI
jgi:hypothetical protein